MASPALHLISDDLASALADVDYTNTTPATGHSLVYTAAGAWEPVASGTSTLVGLTDTNIATPAIGQILVYDNTASVWDNVALATGDGIASTAGDGTLSIAADVNGLTAETTVAPAADFVMMYDTSASAHRKVLVSNIISSVDTLVELTDTNIAATAAGHILVYDNTASVWDNVAIATGTGLAETLGDGTLALDLSITTLVTTTIDPAADFIPFFDVSGAVNGKVLVSSLRDDDWRVAAGTAGSDPGYADNKRTNGLVGIAFDPTTNLDAGAGTVNAALGVTGDVAVGMGGTGGTGLIMESADGTRWRVTMGNTGAMTATSLV